MGSVRLEKVSEALRQTVSQILQKDLTSPDIGFITITKVEVSPDLRYAKVYYSILGEKGKLPKAQKALTKSIGFIRKLVGERVRLRYTPQIKFVYDKSIEYSARISELLHKAEQEDQAKT